MSRRGPARRSSVKRQSGWIRVLFDEIVVDDSPIVGNNLIQGSDWAVGTMAERATMTRLFGRLDVSPGIEDTGSVLFWAVYRSDQDAGFVDPSTTAILDEDLLALGAIAWPGRAATAVEAQLTKRMDFDVKAMRRLTSDEVVKHVMIGSQAGRGWSVSGFTSALLSRGKSS